MGLRKRRKAGLLLRCIAAPEGFATPDLKEASALLGELS